MNSLIMFSEVLNEVPHPCNMADASKIYAVSVEAFHTRYFWRLACRNGTPCRLMLSSEADA